MKHFLLGPLLACCALPLWMFPSVARGADDVLARVEAVDRVDRLGLPVHAHLRDAAGKAYALVVATEFDLQRSGWPFSVLARNPDLVALALAVEKIPGAAALARKRVKVLYEDGRRLVVTPTPAQAAEITELGMAVIRIGAPLIWTSAPEDTAAALRAPRAVAADPVVSNLMAQIRQDAVSNLTDQLSGETPATIGGESYTILTRGTSLGEANRKACQFVYEQMEAAGLEVSLQGWTNESYSGQNVVGVKRGATLPDEVILVTAHVDDMPDDGTRAPGADDNASGCVAAMLAASVMRGCPMDRTVRFICFGGEEQGLLGSGAYAASIHSAGETNVTVFNMDMIAYSTLPSHVLNIHTRLATDPGYAADMAVAVAFQDVLSAYGLDSSLTLVIDPSGEDGSDHYRFWQKGYPGVLAIECLTNFNPYYHTRGDAVSNINMAYCTDFVRAAVGTVAHLAGVIHAPPDAPAGVAASAWTYWDKVRVTWSAVSNATSYIIFRSLTNDSASASQVGSTDTTCYDDTGATNWPETPLYYWVKASNNQTTSVFSAMAQGCCDQDPAVQQPLSGDFDGDFKNDLVLYQESSGIWSAKLSSLNYAPASATFGGLDCQPMAKDFDGDFKADLGIYDEATGDWAVMLSGSGYAIARLLGFGGAGYTTVVADYDGDLKADPAVYQASNSLWLVKLSGGDYGIVVLSDFGGAGYTALALDFDGDGKADPGIYQAAAGDWTVKLSGSGYVPADIVGFGGPGYEPVSGFYDNDTRADAGIYNPANGNWTILLSASAYITGTLWGFGGDGYTPVVGDFDGDGKADPALYLPAVPSAQPMQAGQASTSTWYVRLSGSGYNLFQAQQ